MKVLADALAWILKRVSQLAASIRLLQLDTLSSVRSRLKVQGHAGEVCRSETCSSMLLAIGKSHRSSWHIQISTRKLNLPFQAVLLPYVWPPFFEEWQGAASRGGVQTRLYCMEV